MSSLKQRSKLFTFLVILGLFALTLTVIVSNIPVDSLFDSNQDQSSQDNQSSSSSLFVNPNSPVISNSAQGVSE
jgi:hypothetical protein